MTKKTTISIVLLLLVGNIISTAQGIPFDKIQIITNRISQHFYLLTGSPNIDPGHPEAAGGRIGVFAGPEGVIMVDAQYAPLTKKVNAAIKHLSNAPIRFLINTHEHPDHTGGNPNFAHMGVTIISSEYTQNELAQPFPPKVAAAIGNAASSSDSLRLPVIIFPQNDSFKIHINGETIDIFSLGPAHTDGDLLVFFRNENVIMIGDIYRNYGYPFIDRLHGGSFAGMLAALDKVMRLSDDNTFIVPGHGSVVKKSTIPAYIKMIVSVREKVTRMIRDGKSKTDVLAARLTADYDTKVPGGTDVLPAGLGTSADRFVGSLYDELIDDKKIKK